MNLLEYPKHIALVAVPAVMLTLASCDSTTAPRDLGAVPDVAFSTDATGYVAKRLSGGAARYQFTVISRFENRGNVPLYLGRCYPTTPQPIFGVEVAGGTGESAYSQVWGCVGHDKQFEMLPGAVRIDTLQVGGPNVFPSGSNVGFGATSGRFQLYFDVRLAPGDGAPQAPRQSQLSNEFLVQTDN